MEKIVKNGLRDCTVNLDGSECAVKFDTCFRAFAVRNDGAADIYISKSSGIVPDDDGVMCVKSGASAVFAHMDIYADTVYLIGTSKVQVHAQNDSANPFNYAPTTDGGVTAEGNFIQMDNLQGGVPFSEMVVSGKNLVPFPYYDGNSKTHYGITFTVNSDGSVTANGTATENSIFYFVAPSKDTAIHLKKGTYTLSGCPAGGSLSTYAILFALQDWSLGMTDFGEGYTRELTEDADYYWAHIRIAKGYTVDNLVFRPQLELGATPTEYEPPITGRELTVGVSGKNLIPTDYMSRSGTYNGVTFSVNDNGKFDISGTATKGFALVSFIKNMSLVGGKKYTFSCNKQYDINTFNCAAKILTKDGIWKHSVTSYPSTIIASDGDYIGLFGIWANEGVEISAENVEIQLEIGDTATEYETPVGSKITITPTSNPYVIPNDIRQQDGLNVVSVSEGELSVTGVRKNAAVKKIWDKIDELTTAIIVSNGETIE